jgi:hypothetical protein
VSAAEPRRLTPTERLHEVTMAAMTRAPSPPEHVAEITRNLKGLWQFSVTVRGFDLAEVISQAKGAARELDGDFPYQPANGSGDDETGADKTARRAAAIARSATR